MLREMPGCALRYDDSEPHGAETLLGALFAGGPLMLSQVSHISGLEPYVIQNWVARGFLPPPVGKKYSRRQLSRILLIHTLRGILTLENIVRLLSYVNGHLDDVSDDTVDDSQLYLWLLRCVHAPAGEERAAMAACLEEYEEPFQGAGKRLEQVLEILITAAAAAEMQAKARAMIDGLDVC